MAAPIITSLNPNSGPVGSNIHIFGSNFFIPSQPQNVPSVTFNGVSATVLGYNGAQVYAQVPTGATTGNVVVNTPTGGNSNGILFTVTGTAPPTLTSINPVSGRPGTAVTITGTNFGASQNTSTVTFNGALASVVSWSPTVIVASVPATATTGFVVVTVGGSASNGEFFTVGAASNGGMLQPLNQFLILGLSGAVPTIWALDPTNFDDPVFGGFYLWKVEDVIAGRTPTINRVIISYRDLGVAAFTLTLTGTNDSGAVVSNSKLITVGTASASQRIASTVIGLALTGQNIQVSVSRSPGSGPVSITKVRMEGKVETTTY